MATNELSNEKKLVVAVVILVAAVVVVWVGVGYFKSKTVANAGCALGTGAVATLAAAVSKGRSTDEVVKIAGPTLAGGACTATVEKLVNNKPATVQINTGTRTVPTTLTRSRLTGTIQKPASSRAFACRGWTVPVLFDMCIDGELAPR